jgi:glyoxylase-like metal-dependent hydrolase (beta-lactamase superfamily II)
LISEEKKVLIDSGPTNSAEYILNGIKVNGIRPEDIDYIILTHVHLDHCGGVGNLLRFMPKARAVVHREGARHLVDPTKLIASTVASQGEEIIMKYGEVVPVEPGRLWVVSDGDTLRLSDGQVLKFVDAPGHAPHELCIHESRNNGIFVGDAVGIIVLEIGVLIPGPNNNLEASVNTLKKLMGLNAAVIYFSHFGATNKVRWVLQMAIDKLQLWDEIVDKAIADDVFESAGERIVAQTCAELDEVKEMGCLYDYITNRLVPLSASFHIKYYQRKV